MVHPTHAPSPALDIERVREDFPILRRQVHGKRLVYLDNSATTQRPACVTDAMTDFYGTSNANVHRGVHQLSEEATDAYEGARRKVAQFINADGPDSIILRSQQPAVGGLDPQKVEEVAADNRRRLPLRRKR